MANLSRSHRPKLFSEIYGQESITKTLSRQVELKKIGHAYLFAGPRGIGKTTAARIFAKAINCQDPQAGEPCLRCQACQRAAAGSLDIIEMDAASNTGVDNVREAIVEHVRFVPAELKYKVYIIDEAHMLSTSAWNALLKTIEEPPEYAVFIFATTEKHKVPATIVSRCQRFDFRRIAEGAIIQRLGELAGREKVSVADEVYRLIASRSEGCLRDAENLLGQLMGLGGKSITPDVASLVIPVSQLPQAIGLMALAGQRDITGAMSRINELEQEGAAFLPMFDDMLEAARALISRSASDEMLAATAVLSGLFAPRELLNISLLLMERRKDVKNGLDARFAMEMAMLAIASGAAQDQGRQPPDSAQGGSGTSQTAEALPKAQSKSETKPQGGETSSARSPVAKSLAEAWAAWPKLLSALESNKSLLFILKLCRLQSWEGGRLVIGFRYPYHQQTILGNQQNKLMIENKLREILGNPNLTIEGSVFDEVKDLQDKKILPKDTVSALINAFGGQVAT